MLGDDTKIKAPFPIAVENKQEAEAFWKCG
jgi:hypothetical protein